MLEERRFLRRVGLQEDVKNFVDRTSYQSIGFRKATRVKTKEFPPKLKKLPEILRSLKAPNEQFSKAPAFLLIGREDGDLNDG